MQRIFDFIQREKGEIPEEFKLYKEYQQEKNKYKKTLIFLWIACRERQPIPNEFKYTGYEKDFIKDWIIFRNNENIPDEFYIDTQEEFSQNSNLYLWIKYRVGEPILWILCTKKFNTQKDDYGNTPESIWKIYRK